MKFKGYYVKFRNYYINNKKEISTLIFITLFSIIIYSNYLRPHYVHDSYRIYNFGFFENLKGFFTQGRLFSLLYNLTMGYLNVPIHIAQMFSVIFTIILMCISSYIVYSIIKRELQINNLILFICIALIFINPYITEWMMFMESWIHSLGTLFSVLAARAYFNNIRYKRYVYASILFILSSFCYQGSMSIGIVIIILLTVCKNKENKLMNIVKEVIFSVIPYIISLVINFSFVKIVGLFLKNDIRISGSINIFHNVLFVIKQARWYLIDMFGFVPYKIFFIAFIVINFFICFSFIKNTKTNKKEKTKLLMYVYSIIIFLIFIIISVLPIIAMPTGTQYFMPRSVPYIGGYLMMFLVVLSLMYDKEILKNKITIVLVILYICINSIIIINITSETLLNNQKDIEIGRQIYKEVLEYERKNNIKITDISLVVEKNYSLNNNGIYHYSDCSVKAFLHDYTVKEIMAFVSNSREFNVNYAAEITKEELYGDTDYNEFNIEQIKFKDNNMYLVIY